jgi:hypothetical protein
VFCVLISALLANANWDVSLRTEARGGTVPNTIVNQNSDGTTGTVSNDRGGTGQVDGTLGVSGEYEDLTYSATWQPHYLRATVAENQPNELLNAGRLLGVYRLSSISRLTFGQTFAYGVQDFSPLVAGELASFANTGATGTQTTTGGTTRQQLAGRLVYLNSVSNLAFDTALSHLVKFNLAGSYFITGGADQVGREFLPLQHGVTLSSGLGWTASRENVFSATLLATGTSFNPSQRSETGSLALGWRRVVNDRTNVDAGLGIGAGAAQGGAQPVTGVPFPVASAGITHTIPLRNASVSGGLHATLSPNIDPVTGSIYELLTGSADLSWSPATILRFSAHAGYGHAFSGTQEQGQELLSGDLSATVALNAHTTFSTGVRGARDYFPPGVQVTTLTPTTQPIVTLQAFQQLDWAVFAAFAFSYRGPL